MKKVLQFFLLFMLLNAVNASMTPLTSKSVEKTATRDRDIPAIPFSSQNQDTRLPCEFPDEASEDEDDQARELEVSSGPYAGLISKSIAQLQLLFKEHHREINSPPPRS